MTIQKRTMIFVSDHAFISKWWWIGAILSTIGFVLFYRYYLRFKL